MLRTKPSAAATPLEEKETHVFRRSRLALLMLVVFALRACSALGAGAFSFEDVTKKLGLADFMTPYEYGHAAAWGDVDGDGRPDLYVGAFSSYPLFRADDAPIPNMLFLNKANGFVRSPDRAVRMDARFANSSGAIFVDLDNDGDLDLLVSSFVVSNSLLRKDGNRREPWGGGPSMLFENTGAGRFAEISPMPGWPFDVSARNATPIDLDRDGLLDLVIADGHYVRWDDVNLIVLRNKGNLEFENITEQSGFPKGGMRGLGMAVGDVNHDGRFDLFIAHCNRLMLSTPDGAYREAQAGSFPGPTWEPTSDSPWPCGAAFGDLNGDDRLDLVYTVHSVPTRLHVFLSEATAAGERRFVDRTQAVGLDRIIPKTKTTHVALRDVNNDGLVDIALANVYTDSSGRLQPLVLPNLGLKDGLPRFSMPPVEQITIYETAAPMADFDGDGRIDIALVSWFKNESFLFRNVSDAGHWIAVRVRGDGKQFNTMGIGSIVRAYRAGHAGKLEHLLGRYDMAVGFGYSSGQEAIAHIGLGTEAACDLVVSWAGTTQTIANSPVDRTVEITFPGE